MNNINVNYHVSEQDPGLKAYFSYIYQNVALGLLLAGAVSFFVANVPVVRNLIFGTPLFFVVLFGPLALSLYMNIKIESMSTKKAEGLYWAYTALIGASIAGIFLIYSYSSVVSAFLISGGVFFAASAYGRTTDTDLSQFKNVLFVGLIGVMLAMLTNLILQNSMLDMLISVFCVVLFTALIAYKNQELQALYYMRASRDMVQKIAILGSLSLFISFVNLFLSVLRLMGSRRD